MLSTDGGNNYSTLLQRSVDFDRALELSPELYDARMQRAAFRRQAGDLQGALADVRHALRDVPHAIADYRALAAGVLMVVALLATLIPARAARQLADGVVVAVPKRGGLLYAPLSDEAAVGRLRRGVRQLHASSGRLGVSAALYLFKDGRWSVLQAAPAP